MKQLLEMLYSALIESTDDFIYINDCQTGVFRYPKALVDMFDFPGEEVANPMPHWERIIHPDDWERFYRKNMEIIENKTDEHIVEFRAKNKNDEYIWLRCKGKLIREENGEPMYFAGVMSIMGRENKIDPLTQLLNHAEFYMGLDWHIMRTAVERMAVIMIDVDEFRQINEMYDRETGDLILKLLGKTVQGLLPNNASLFRLEKDKMGILMTNVGHEEVEALYQDMRDELLRGREWKKHRLDIEISAGCALYPDNGTTAEELYRYTDYALQSAKDHGKNRLVFFSEDILRDKECSLSLLRQLRECVKEGYRGFYLTYQPQIQPETGNIKGVEVLMRWKNAEGEVISPATFIPVLEEHGLIYQAGLWALRTALQEGKEWVERNPAFTISVNVSAMQFLEDDFLTDLYRIIEEEQFPFENLIIELTESFAFKNIDILQERFEELRSRKLRIALDDFGTGYCSMAALKHTPVDIVKIDRTFVKDMLNNQFDVNFINMVTEICHAVSIDVCLEGIEQSAEFDFVKKIPLDAIQGFYFGRPMEKSAINAIL